MLVMADWDEKGGCKGCMICLQQPLRNSELYYLYEIYILMLHSGVSIIRCLQRRC